MEETPVDQIRAVTFTTARRGYEKREVEAFLNKLADWLETGGDDEARAQLVKRELERVGKKTAGVLAAAEESAEQLRADAEREAAELLSGTEAEVKKLRTGAEEYEQSTRKAADEYAEKTRAGADQDAAQARAEAQRDARETIQSAEAKARRIIDEGTKRRTDIEAVIADLTERRDEVLGRVDQLAATLKETATAHRPGPDGDPFATPSEPDPEERAEAPAKSAAKSRSGQRVGR